MTGISADGTTYTDSYGKTHPFLGAWNPNTIYRNNDGTGATDDPNGAVVEYGGGYFQVVFYNQDVNPLLANEGVNQSNQQPWLTLASPISKSVAPQAPGAPTASYLTASSVSLTWAPSLVLGAGDVSSYQVYEGTSANFSTGTATLVGTTTSSSLTVNGLSPTTSYYFKVVAVDVTGQSPASASSAAITTTDMNPDSGKFFSPFVDLTQPSENLVSDTATAGLRDFTIAFLNSAGLQSPQLSPGSTTTSGTSVPTPNYGMYANDGSAPTMTLGGATVEPNGIPVLNSGAILGSVKQVESEGGTVTVAVGGYTGRDPAIIAAEYGAYLNGTPFSYTENSGGMVVTNGGTAATAGSNAYNQAVANLQAEYQNAVTSTGANAITFDTENDSVPNEQWSYQSGGYWKETPASSGPSVYQTDILGNSTLDEAADAMRNQAILGLEAANPNLSVAFTLAVLPTGLSDGSNTSTGGGGVAGGVGSSDNAQALLLQAQAAGVKINTVDIMAMDYGTANNANGTSYNDYQTGGTAMAQAAEQAATATESFLVANGMASTKVEITPMLGQNDTPGEVFTLNDATALEAWAATKPWVAGLGEWSLNRDHASAAGQGATSTGSGLPNQTNFQLSDALDVIENAATVATMNANLSTLNALPNGFAVGDTEANIFNGIASLQSEASHIESIYASDNVPVAVGITKFQADQAALDKVVGGFSILGMSSLIENDIAGIQADLSNINSVAAVDAVISVGVGKFTPDEGALNKITAGFSILGMSPAISSDFDALNADSSHINTLSFADANPVLSLTQAQTTSDASLLAKVTGNYISQVANTNGTVSITGHGAGLVINATSQGGDTITGGGSNDTFVFQPSFGQDTITDFANYLSGSTHDTIALPSSEFANFAAVLNDATYSSSGATITAPSNGDKLFLQNVTASALSGASADFKFG